MKITTNTIIITTCLWILFVLSICQLKKENWWFSSNSDDKSDDKKTIDNPVPPSAASAAQPAASAAQPAASAAQPAASAAQPAAPVAQPAAPVAQPAAPVAQPATSVTQHVDESNPYQVGDTDEYRSDIEQNFDGNIPTRHELRNFENWDQSALVHCNGQTYSIFDIDGLGNDKKLYMVSVKDKTLLNQVVNDLVNTFRTTISRSDLLLMRGFGIFSGPLQLMHLEYLLQHSLVKHIECDGVVYGGLPVPPEPGTQEPPGTTEPIGNPTNIIPNDKLVDKDWRDYQELLPTKITDDDRYTKGPSETLIGGTPNPYYNTTNNNDSYKLDDKIMAELMSKLSKDELAELASYYQATKVH